MTIQTKVFVVMPAFKHSNTSFTTQSLVALANVLTEQKLWGGFATMSYPDIADLRNVIFTLWYEKIDATHLLFIDDDMYFEPSIVMDMFFFGRPLVASLYAKKTLPIEMVGEPLDGPEIRDGKFLKVKSVGAGIMLIRRDCAEEMIAKMPELVDTRILKTATHDLLQQQGIPHVIRAFDKIQTDTGPRSEDLSFCDRWRQCGGEVWANTDVVGHIGVHSFRGIYKANGGDQNGKN